MRGRWRPARFFEFLIFSVGSGTGAHKTDAENVELDVEVALDSSTARKL